MRSPPGWPEGGGGGPEAAERAEPRVFAGATRWAVSWNVDDGGVVVWVCVGTGTGIVFWDGSSVPRYVGNGGVNLHECIDMGRVLECRRSSCGSVWVRRGGMNLLRHGKLITVVRILNLHGCNKMGRVMEWRGWSGEALRGCRVKTFAGAGCVGGHGCKMVVG